MSKEIELKACPYCGEEPIVLWTDGNMVCRVECTWCEVRGPAATVESKAVDGWNALPRALVWSSEPPSEPGFWWWELCGHRGVDLIQDPEKRVVRDYRAKWAGPIPEPKEAK